MDEKYYPAKLISAKAMTMIRIRILPTGDVRAATPLTRRELVP